MYRKRNNRLKVIALYLGDYAQQFYLREISKLTNIPLKTTQNLLLNLENERILKSITRGKNKYFYLNLDNIITKFYLLQSEIHRTALFLDKYTLFKTFLKEIKTENPLIIFGSFAKFAAQKDSDVDILIITKEKIKLPLHLLPYKTQEINFSRTAFTKALQKQETLIKEIEQKHIILNNHSFYVNTMWGHYGK